MEQADYAQAIKTIRWKTGIGKKDFSQMIKMHHF
jgi:hypothetical protein